MPPEPPAPRPLGAPPGERPEGARVHNGIVYRVLNENTEHVSFIILGLTSYPADQLWEHFRVGITIYKRKMPGRPANTPIVRVGPFEYVVADEKYQEWVRSSLATYREWKKTAIANGIKRYKKTLQRRCRRTLRRWRRTQLKRLRRTSSSSRSVRAMMSVKV